MNRQNISHRMSNCEDPDQTVHELSDQGLHCSIRHICVQRFSFLSEVGARGLLNLGKKHLGHLNWENLMQSKNTGLPF